MVLTMGRHIGVARELTARAASRLRGVERGVRIAFEQCGQPGGVDVVRVLMGDHDRRQAGDALEPMRESSRVEQQGGVAEVGEYAGMAKMRQLHVYDCALMGCVACA